MGSAEQKQSLEKCYRYDWPHRDTNQRAPIKMPVGELMNKLMNDTRGNGEETAAAGLCYGGKARGRTTVLNAAWIQPIDRVKGQNNVDCSFSSTAHHPCTEDNKKVKGFHWVHGASWKISKHRTQRKPECGLLSWYRITDTFLLLLWILNQVDLSVMQRKQSKCEHAKTQIWSQPATDCL